MCSHTLAVACVLGRVLDFCIEVKKNWIESSKRGKTVPNLTAGIETGLPLTKRGMKKNEVPKAARRKRTEKQKKDDLFTRSSEQSTTVQSRQSLSKPGTSQPCLSFSGYLNLDNYNSTTSGYLPSSGSSQASFQNSLYTSYPSSSFTQSLVFHPSHHIGSLQPALTSSFGEQSNSMESSTAFSHHSYPYRPLGAPAYHSVISGTKTFWNTSMSPHLYELVIFPNDVKKYYGCGQEFAAKYKTPPHNIIVSHRDKRIRGKDANGRITYNEEFRQTYYHLEISHIKIKNPIFDGIV